MTSIEGKIGPDRIEQWTERDAEHREQLAQQAQGAWTDVIEPSERAQYIEEAEADWDDSLAAERGDQYVNRMLDAWDADAVNRYDEFLRQTEHDAPKPVRSVRSAKVEGIRAWGAAWLASNPQGGQK